MIRIVLFSPSLIQILLNTMHKYFFEIVVEEHRSDSEPLVFPFHLTQFVAVTAYQSAKLTELKKEKNPFARGVKHHDSETDSPQIHPIYHTGKFFFSVGVTYLTINNFIYRFFTPVRGLQCPSLPVQF